MYSRNSESHSLAKVQSIMVGSSQNFYEDNVIVDNDQEQSDDKIFIMKYDWFYKINNIINTIIITDEESKQQVSSSDEFEDEEGSQSYQERFKLSDIAINSLIGFFSLVLKDIDLRRFEEFPPTTYMARKLLDIRKKSKTFATCLDCNKLYDSTTIILANSNNNMNLGFKCIHIEFPNHPI
ncbi:2159_t:CDS:2 [Funneliformis caledonium]|uniref:2159_t:CDS:1 n=1 Tax=Funneliformis caledonium TaxID=1117310 RepID=A0A9N9EYC0_9GLOM|nr:2159_t:CDS:2 [Funneliformis caledonium]